MSAMGPYVLDSDVFITAKNRYYGFDICPGFWESLIHQHGRGSVCSIDRVKNELLAGNKKEDLVVWVSDTLPPQFFRDTNEEAVTEAYGRVMLWSQRHRRYFDRAKAEFATKADGWLVAYAMANSLTVFTNEQPSPESRREIYLPDACEQFGVNYGDTFWMLRQLQVRYEFRI